MGSVFFSHSSKDKSLARRIADDLRKRGVQVWLDEWEILVGDSITQRIQHGLEQSEFVAVLLTRQSVQSGWVEKEWQGKIGQEAASRQVTVLPLKADDCVIPALLRDKRYADFRQDYNSGFNDLLTAITGHTGRRRSTDSLRQMQGSQERRRSSVETTIAITLSEELLNTLLRFGLLHVRDGKDEVPDHGPLLNKETYFNELDDRGTLIVKVAHDPGLGFQFKCFVDHRGYSFERVKKALEANGFYEVTKGEGKKFRAWFLLRNYNVCSTIDGIRNNFFYPA